MKRNEVFEVLEPPPHGLTRLRARMATRRATRLLRPALALALAFAAVVVLLFVPRAAPVDLTPDLRASLTGSLLGLGSGGAPVTSLDGRAAAVERMPSGNPKVVLYRVAVLAEAP
jgi:hypothetical protein